LDLPIDIFSYILNIDNRISSDITGMTEMLAIGNSSRYSRSRFLVRWLSG
jgi:hypothetical protein